MQFEKNGITLTVSEASLQRLVLDRLTEAEIILPDDFAEIGDPSPRIGEMWSAQGGVYAGIARGRDKHGDYHLIVGPENDSDIDWVAADKWAATLQQHGFADYSLPFRREQALCFANVPELFGERVYWSCEQHASNSGYAWLQDFSDGYQDYWGKDSELRARAVRRLPIQ